MMPELEVVAPVRSRKLNTQEVLHALEEMCEGLEPGARIPTRTELMRRLDASERAVLSALDELRRRGRVVVRNGAGTFVAEPQSFPSVQSDKTLVAVARPDHSFYDRALEVLLAQAEDAGFSLVCRPFDPDKSPPPFLEEATGYLLFGRALAPLAKQLLSADKRVVLMATPAADEVFEVANVRGDQQRGGYLVARHLIALGHRHIAVSGCEDFDMRSPRGLGIQKAVQEAHKAGQPVQISFLSLGQIQRWKNNEEEAHHFWTQPEAPSGIAVWNDHQAILLMGFLTYIGVQVPQQVSLVGYDNLPISEQCHPTLTTIDAALESQLQAALELLTQEQPLNPHQSVVVLPTLVGRNSSASREPIAGDGAVY